MLKIQIKFIIICQMGTISISIDGTNRIRKKNSSFKENKVSSRARSVTCYFPLFHFSSLICLFLVFFRIALKTLNILLSLIFLFYIEVYLIIVNRMARAIRTRSYAQSRSKVDEYKEYKGKKDKNEPQMVHSLFICSTIFH